MKRLFVAALLAAMLAAAPAWAADGADVSTAKAYLAQVKKLLTEAYVRHDKLKAADVETAGLDGLAKAPDHKDFAALPEATRAALKKAVADSKTVDEAMDAAAAAVGDRPFDWLKFADHAAKGMVKSTGDPFSRILTRDEFTKLMGLMQGEGREDSIGLAVQPAEKGFKVAYVQYGYVAYEEGIEIGDEVVEIDGKPIAGQSPEDVNERMKVRPGGEIILSVRRQGAGELYKFRLVQRAVSTRDVHYSMLGDGVGYLRLTIFDMSLARQARKALRELKAEGMKSLILDLRHNPGGALPAATAVADLFLPQGVLITKVDMDYRPEIFGFKIPGLGGDQEYRTKSKSEFERMPMRVLVDHASASASELLVGALQDHKRAILVGETTYGKGVGQTPIPLASSGGGILPERFLYLTVLRYYLPTGRSIDGKGVVPDVECAAKRPSPEKFAELWKVRTSKTLGAYVDAHWKTDNELLRRLATSDEFETARYPDFDDLVKDLSTTLSADEVREELRQALRKRVTREDQATYVYDLETDMQLQYALVSLIDSQK